MGSGPRNTEVRQQRRSLELERLQRELERLESAIDRRNELRESIVSKRVSELIGENDGNIDNVQMRERAADFTKMDIEVEVWDLEHLNRIVAGLRNLKVVGRVERLFE